MSERFLKDKVELRCGDCLEVLPTLAENSIDSCVTDPPYHLTSIVARFGRSQMESGEQQPPNRGAQYKRLSRGFMGRTWDGGDIAQSVELWQQVYRVLKPGAHLLAFGGTRTFHRMACAIEDAGFEIRDTIMWVYGSGFPKSHDVSKGIDKAAGVEREIVGRANGAGSSNTESLGVFASEYNQTVPATATARQWQGWGTALKPACEPIVLARKPLSEGTVAANVLKHGVGALNIDGCRVEYGEAGPDRPFEQSVTTDAAHWGNSTADELQKYKPSGRWPANLIHDGSAEVVAGFPETCRSGESPARRSGIGFQGHGGGTQGERIILDDGAGSAARFFYTSKADSDDRLGSKHPTVKPLDLIQYLVRLITPKGGVCLDPFAGTGTAGEAAWREGCKAVLIEREAEYQADICRRMELAISGPDERARESIKARQGDKAPDYGPLFGGADRDKDWEEMWSKPFDKPELL